MKNILAGTGCALALASWMIGYPQAAGQTPIFEKSPQFIQGASRTWGSAAADLDGDGDLDIVLGALVSGPLVLINDGNGRFRASDQTMDTEMHDIASQDREVSSPDLPEVAGGTFTAATTVVTVSRFRMDKFEVTFELWTEVRDWALTHGYADLPLGQNGHNPVGANNPVTGVDWYSAVKWCNARSEKDGFAPVYFTDIDHRTVYRSGQIDISEEAAKWTATGYRLPTECEWEFAARGGTRTRGYTFSGGNVLGDVAWCSSNSGDTTHPVGQKKPNELGLYDLSGNVYEWCWDWYESTYPIGGPSDPKGSKTALNAQRLQRGCPFYGNDAGCRLNYRSFEHPGQGGRTIGFRCVQTAKR